VFAAQPPVVLDAEQHICGPAPVGDKDGSGFRGPLRTGDIPVEFAAGDGDDGHGRTPQRVQ